MFDPILIYSALIGIILLAIASIVVFRKEYSAKSSKEYAITADDMTIEE